MRDNRDAIAAAIDADFGRVRAKKLKILEFFPIALPVSIMRCGTDGAGCARVGAGRTSAFLPARTEMRPQPLGVVGIIVPWNYPLYLAVGPLTDALAAGNRVMVKMSELTPRFSALFAAIVAKAVSATTKSSSSTAMPMSAAHLPPCPSTICCSPDRPR